MVESRQAQQTVDTLDQVDALEAAGLFLAAHDLARAALDGGSSDERLRVRAVHTLARSGATAAALDLLHRWELADNLDGEIGALGARLLRDHALEQHSAADIVRTAMVAEGAFLRLWQRTGVAWLGVNAAAMALLSGRHEHARECARQVPEPVDGETYWSAATAAERALILGNPERAAYWLDEAEKRASADLARRVTIRRQLRWEAELLGVDPGIVEALRVPSVLHYTGDAPNGVVSLDRVTTALNASVADVGFAYGSLAAGGDIMIAEALLLKGAQLHVQLPFPPDAFEMLYVRPHGGAWVQRYRACLARARVSVLEPAPYDDWSVALAARRAMGLARLQARHLDTKVRQLAVWDGAPFHAAAGTAVDIDAWRNTGFPTQVIESPWPRHPPERPAPRPVREPRAVLFGDLSRFGGLDEAGLAAFYAGPMRALGRAVARERPDYRNAWGDAVQCVFAHPNAAARCALALQDAVSAEALARYKVPATLTPRLALDHGALLPVFDAVQGVRKYAGTVMTRAARIEPVTPPGRIYATEAFACEMALEPFPVVTCDYAGYTRTAKDYGLLQLYWVRPVTRDQRPPPAF